jgi:hypothetical protein
LSAHVEPDTNVEEVEICDISTNDLDDLAFELSQFLSRALARHASTWPGIYLVTREYIMLSRISQPALQCYVPTFQGPSDESSEGIKNFS